MIAKGERSRVDLSTFTERAINVLLLSIAEAKRLGHHYVGTEHILLGLTREGEGIGAGILEANGMTLAKARHAVEHIVGGPRK